METLHPGVLAQLVASVAVLALEPEGQLDWLRSIGLPEGVDELALCLDDGVGCAPWMVENGWLLAGAARAIGALDAHLDDFSGMANAALWTPEAVRSAHEWAEVRRLARVVLFEIPGGDSQVAR